MTKKKSIYTKRNALVLFRDFLELRLSGEDSFNTFGRVKKGELTKSNVIWNFKSYLVEVFPYLTRHDHLQKYDLFEFYDNFFQSVLEKQKNINSLDVNFSIPYKYIGVETIATSVKKMIVYKNGITSICDETKKYMIDAINNTLSSDSPGLQDVLVKEADTKVEEYLIKSRGNKNERYEDFSPFALANLLDEYLNRTSKKYCYQSYQKP